MMIRLNIFLTFTVLRIHAAVVDPVVTNVDPKHELLTEITGRYRVAARHLRETQSTLPFELQFPVHDILKVDGATNELVIRATIRLDYQFEFLHWDSNDTRSRYHDIEEIILSKTTLQSLWLPDVRFTDEDSISFTIERESAKINRDGFVTWTRRGLFTIASSIDLTYYPFDRQHFHFNMQNSQKSVKLNYQKNIHSSLTTSNIHLARSASVWTALFGSTEANTNLTTIPLSVQLNDQPIKPSSSRGWFVRTINIEPKINSNENGSFENLTIHFSIQRRRESHIYTMILPTLFFSFFIFIFYFAPVEAHQRLIIGLLNTFATLMFLIYVDRNLSAEQLSHSPLIIQYLTILFMIEALSLFFDHIIHSIFYGGINFISNWLRSRHKYDTQQQQPARLSRVTMLTRALNNRLNSNTLESDGQISGPTDILMKQLIDREESLKFEDNERYQWRKRARLSECLCCWFFFAIVIAAAICVFLIIPTMGLKK
ncbi:unnamed protein product [Rotaria magnacalcarata]|uniref:Neurotransmitter-gated ion-channel ligand-binding domain-containing protein n=4 Tax=Rotaria magnacalcarata TaxID=392030 RepID=A0A816Q1E3_9BILA|nr:unnamed protein product [Rotaria magnacalcarata]CAF1619019.1 unnamed protein product [Rotaria magnacalcarata]CAF2054190.1 unnamed protein product [Rotaria magnacalcarata]CAF2089909.1 unnamed protein product [Rotaria magnacalcarata]CAF2144998.1 unnamed protein product [Rotaria magnacalcarata]